MKKSGNKSNSGFSLVEVSVAMAIAAVALVSLIGLIPQGLKTMRDAGDRAIEARIHQQILSELQMTPVRGTAGDPDIQKSPLKSFHEQVRAYDSQGVELGYQAGGTFIPASGYSTEELSFNWNYTARIWLPAFVSGRVPDKVGGGNVDNEERTYDGLPTYEYLTVIVETVAAPVAPGSDDPVLDGTLADKVDTFLANPDNFRNIQVFQTNIVRTGNDFRANGTTP